LTSKEYKQGNIPWFDYYRDDLSAVSGSTILEKVKSVFTVSQEKQLPLLPENESVQPELVVQYGNARRPDTVREFAD
jgi:hypothetical protein